ncbi:MAG TPA: sulfate ABC transporter substrate-binding protein [Chloroflexota bacterium]
MIVYVKIGCMPPTRALLLLALALPCLIFASAACSPAASPSSAAATRLSLVAYSTPREAYAALIKAFQATPAGAGVTFDESYNGSTEQSRAVADGLPADLVALSLEPDITTLVNAGVVDSTWNQDPLHGMVSASVVVLVVRKGNPRHIEDWADLLQPGIEVVTPNPLTSGGARWNLLAAYGAQIQQAKTEQQASEFLRALLPNVPVMAKSAREGLQAFIGGKGDALLSYENEAITAQQKGEQIDYVVPQATVLIENPVALTAQGRKQPQAQAFLEFLRSADGQRIFAKAGYRPVLPLVAAEAGYPQPAHLFTATDMGGWPAIDKQLFDRRSGLLVELFRSRGIDTGGN